MGVTPTMLYWNKALFKAAGIADAPKTWDEWAADAVKLTDVSGADNAKKYGFAIPDHAAIPQWAILLWGNGADVVSADGKKSTFGDPAAIEAVDYWAKLVVDKHISPVGLGGVEGDNLFGSGRAAMIVNGPWASAGYTQAGVDFGIANVPAGPKAQANNAVAIEMVVSAGATDPQKAAANKFITFWNSVDSQKTFSKTGYPATRTDVPADQLSNPTAQAFAAGATSAHFFLAGVVNYAQINDTIFTPTIQRITNGQGTAKDLLPQASQQIDALLQQ
jgi:multiple sugar transport system substrate-binding protein